MSSVTAAAAAVLLLSAASARADGPNLPFAKVEMQGLDKVTARVSAFEAPVDGEVRFGTLAIRVRACLETPPTEAPESAAFLEIRDVGPSAGGDTGFNGWMFASSPALSALEHPVYDVWVVGCADPLPEPAPPEPASPAPSSPAAPLPWENG